MPEICRFLGISIIMYFNDHNPPHYHVKYNEYRAILEIGTSRIMDGELPPRVLGLVVEWAGLHRTELIEDWELIRSTGEYKAIEPLV
jgi:hypothetical protein